MKKHKFIIIIIINILIGCTVEIKPPTFNLDQGIYNEPVTVYITNWNNYDSILYTTDGSTPKKNRLLSMNTEIYEGQKWKIKKGKKIKLRYIAFKRWNKPTEVLEYNLSVMDKCKEPILEIQDNILSFIKTDSKIYYSIDENKKEFTNYTRQFKLADGDYKIKYYAEQSEMQNSDIVEKEIKIKAPKVSPPEISIDRNVVTLLGDGDIYYSLNDGKDILYKEPLKLKKGKLSIKYYSKKIIDNNVLESDKKSFETNIEEEKRDLEYKRSEIDIDDDAEIERINNYSFLIGKYEIKKIDKNMKLIKKIELDKKYQVKNTEIVGDEFLIHVLDTKENKYRVMEIDDMLHIKSDREIGKEVFDVVTADENHYYAANSIGIKKILKKSNEIDEKIDLKDKNITKIIEMKIKNNTVFIAGEKTKNLANVELFTAEIKDGKINITTVNSKETNEYFLGSCNGYIYGLGNRENINVYKNNGENIAKEEFFDSVVVNNVIRIEPETIFIGKYIKTENIFLGLFKDDLFYVYKNRAEKMTPLNAYRIKDEYIIEEMEYNKETRNNIYVKMIVNEKLVNLKQK